MKQLLAYLPAAVWLVLVTILSTGGGVPMPKFNLIGPDKLAHAASYALLAGLLLFGYQKSSGRQPNLRVFIVVFCFAAGYGALMEWVQDTFYPNRFYEFDDMLANSIGALAAVGIAGFRQRKSAKN